MSSFRSLGSALAALMLLCAPAVWLWLTPASPPSAAPLAVAQAYLRAFHARDLRQAYRYISTVDRRARDEARYLRAQQRNHGFALRLARTAAAYGSVALRSYSADAAGRVEIGLAYRFPALDELTPLIRGWDVDRLNKLLPTEQQEILRQLEHRQRDGKLIMIEGQEKFLLTNEPTGWKILFDWAQGIPVQLNVSTNSAEIEAHLDQKEIMVTGDEPFQVYLTVRNHSRSARRVTLWHQVEPPSLGEELAMIECGLTRPVTLAPTSEREFAMAYLLGSQARQSTKKIALTYRIEAVPVP